MKRNEVLILTALATAMVLVVVAVVVTLVRPDPSEGARWSNTVVGTVTEESYPTETCEPRKVPLCIELGDCSLNGNTRRV